MTCCEASMCLVFKFVIWIFVTLNYIGFQLVHLTPLSLTAADSHASFPSFQLSKSVA